MERIMNLIIEDRNEETSSFVVSYRIKEGVEDPEKALRDAVREFVNNNTAEAQKALAYACGFFNWGDAMSSVPDSLLEKHGLIPFSQNAMDVFVHHDEILCDKEADKTEDDSDE